MEEGDRKTVLVDVQYEDGYVQPLILAALQSRLPQLEIRTSGEVPDNRNTRVVQWRQYERLDFDRAALADDTFLINAYIIRKALIRKHYLSTTIGNWLVKNPDSVLQNHFKASYNFELDYAEFLDDALVECFELNASLEQNAQLGPESREWWILKPGMSDRGQGIRLFSSLDELTTIFEAWEEDSDSEVEADDEAGAGTMTSQLRDFVAQPYIHKPLIFDPPFASAGRKFHIRTYIVAVGALKVYVYKPMLALFAGKEYRPPWSVDVETLNADLASHLTNTCLQTGERDGSVHLLSSLPEPTCLPQGWKDKVIAQICSATGEMFEAAARGMTIHFQPMPNAFEIFGLDFLVDDTGCPWLLEVNAFPDFKQTGKDLDVVIQGLFEGVVDVAIEPFHMNGGGESDDMVKVLDIDLGRR